MLSFLSAVSFYFQLLFLRLRYVRLFGMALPEILLITAPSLWATHRNCQKSSWSEYLFFFFKNMFHFFLLAVAVHTLFGVHTQLQYWLGLSSCPPNLNSLSGLFNCSVYPSDYYESLKQLTMPYRDMLDYPSGYICQLYSCVN